MLFYFEEKMRASAGIKEFDVEAFRTLALDGFKEFSVLAHVCGFMASLLVVLLLSSGQEQRLFLQGYLFGFSICKTCELIGPHLGPASPEMMSFLFIVEPIIPALPLLLITWYWLDEEASDSSSALLWDGRNPSESSRDPSNNDYKCDLCEHHMTSPACGPCGHPACVECYRTWLPNIPTDYGTCPFCRSNVSLFDLRYHGTGQYVFPR
jgi:hypothetical protein